MEYAKKTDRIRFRLPPEVKNEIEKIAAPRGVAKYIRDAVIERLKRDRKRKM
jgi:hypothetical protein